MERQQNGSNITALVLTVCSVIFLAGMQTVFAPCGPKEDGSWMTCHWAGMAVTGLSVVMVVTALAHFVFKDRGIRTGLSLAMIPAAVLSALIPGVLIRLCMMDTMRCHTHTRPGAIVCALLVIIAAVADILKNRIR